MLDMCSGNLPAHDDKRSWIVHEMCRWCFFCVWRLCVHPLPRWLVQPYGWNCHLPRVPGRILLQWLPVDEVHGCARGR